MAKRKIDPSIWDQLSTLAWKARENASIFGKTKVGCSLITETGAIYTGCNCEHIYRSHDIHAEVNAISNMIVNGEKKFIAILIVAERDFFTPCGSCMDWIMQHGIEECLVAFENKENKRVIYSSKELMPFYPR